MRASAVVTVLALLVVAPAGTAQADDVEPERVREGAPGADISDLRESGDAIAQAPGQGPEVAPMPVAPVAQGAAGTASGGSHAERTGAAADARGASDGAEGMPPRSAPLPVGPIPVANHPVVMKLREELQTMSAPRGPLSVLELPGAAPVADGGDASRGRADAGWPEGLHLMDQTMTEDHRHVETPAARESMGAVPRPDGPSERPTETEEPPTSGRRAALAAAPPGDGPDAPVTAPGGPPADPKPSAGTAKKGASSFMPGAVAAAAALVLWHVVAFFAPLLTARRRDPLAHEARRALDEAVRSHPGSHLRELMAATGLAMGQATHHLKVLVAAGTIVRVRLGGFVCFFPDQDSAATLATSAAVLRSPRARRLLRRVDRHPGRTVTEVERVEGLPKGGLRYHAARLEDAGLLRVERRGNARFLDVTADGRDIAQLLHGRGVGHGSRGSMDSGVTCPS